MCVCKYTKHLPFDNGIKLVFILCVPSPGLKQTTYSTICP